MGFIDDLKKGLPGLKFAIPDSWRRQEEQDRRAVLIDSEHKVGWHILHAPWRVDLRRENWDQIRRDIDRHARFGFEQHYVQIPQPQGAPPRPPVRTSDPEFNPVVSSELIEIDGQPALLTIRRVAYEPVMEAVVANVLLPLATGVVDITVFQHTQDTGYRETALLNLALQKYPGEGVQKLARRLGQAYFDDPSNDVQYPTHPLSSVRKALAWLRSLGKDQLAISAPAPALPAAGAEVEINAAGCAVKPPARYQLVPEGVLPVPPGTALFSRVILEAADDPQMLDVRQVAGISLPPDDRKGRLQALVQRQVQEWQAQGATDIQVDAKQVDMPVDPAVGGDGPRIALAVQVSMKLGGALTQTAARWIADSDGRVFRIGVATPPYVPIEEAVADIDVALKSFRRLPVAKQATTAWLTSDLRLAPAKRATQTQSQN